MIYLKTTTTLFLSLKYFTYDILGPKAQDFLQAPFRHLYYAINTQEARPRDEKLKDVPSEEVPIDPALHPCERNASTGVERTGAQGGDEIVHVGVRQQQVCQGGTPCAAVPFIPATISYSNCRTK